MPSKQVTIQGVMTWEGDVSNVPGTPTHPIYNPVYPSQGLPGSQPYPDQSLPGNQPYPGQGLPGNQPYPGQGLPGNQPYPGQGLPGFQPYPDQGLPGQQPRPSHPIFNPPYPTTGPGFPTAPIVIPPVLGIGQPEHPITLPPAVAPPGTAPINPIAGIPVGDNLVMFFLPGYGPVFVYSGDGPPNIGGQPPEPNQDLPEEEGGKKGLFR